MTTPALAAAIEEWREQGRAEVRAQVEAACAALEELRDIHAEDSHKANIVTQYGQGECDAEERTYAECVSILRAALNGGE